jgi:ubiquinol-cytochrome c reductase cytochrome b subunit
MIRRILEWTNRRVGGTSFTRKTLNKVFPDHWSFMLGEVALYCLVVLVGTGTYLALLFHPGPNDVVYDGRYGPLVGIHMSEAYESTVRLSFDVRAGLLIRQVHHWAALVFIFAVLMHLCRVYFTGAYRRPREINWFVGLTMLILAMFNGFTGYSLPDDLLSGTGLRIAHSILVSIPFVGNWLAFLMFGGEFPGRQISERLFVTHVLLVPGLLIGLVIVHLAIVWRQKHTQFPGVGRRDDNVVGSRLWPTYMVRSIGLLLLVAGALFIVGALFQINPIWLFGPYQPSEVSTAAQPDWYMGWIEGALRLAPAIRWRFLGYRAPELLLPAVVLPVVTFAALYLWPAIDARLTGDREEHHLLQRPRDHPVRTSFGVAVLAFYLVLFIGGGQDVIAQQIDVRIDAVTWTLRGLLVVLPLVSAAVAYKMCLDLGREQSFDEFASGGEPPVGPTDPTPDDPTPHDDAPGSVFEGSDRRVRGDRSTSGGVMNALNRWPVVRQLAGPDRSGRSVAVQSRRSASLQPRVKQADQVVKSVCPYCAVGCGQDVYVQRGRVIQIEGDPDSPISRGRLCPKGSASLQLTTGNAREHRVLYRRPHATEWEELDLDVAMDMIADRVITARRHGWQWQHEGKDVRRTLGVACLGGATLDNEENYLIKKLFTALGAIQIENQARI